MKHVFWVFAFLSAYTQVYSQQEIEKTQPVYPLIAQDSLAQAEWVDDIYNQMSLEEKVGQLFMVDLFPEKSQENIDYVQTLIKDYHIGGVIFFKGNPIQQANLTNKFQKSSKVSLLMGQDAEWGLAMRLDSTYAFPWNMTLGAIQDNDLIRQTGAEIAKHAKRIGLQFDFAPTVDVNINPQNPIIGNRAFGENPENVAEKGIAFMHGMQEEGVLTTAKHFPGHGDTDVDSHKALPVLNFSKNRLDSVELYPYYKMIPQGLTGVMVSHLNVPALDSRRNHPASISHPIITGLLKNKMKFNGLIVTDALNMKGVADKNNPSQVSLDAFLAGNDILLYPMNVPGSIQKIIRAYEDDIVTEERLAYSVKKILRAKYKTGLHNYKPVDIQLLIQDLNGIENDVLYEKLMENALTLIKNNKAVIPIRDLDKKRIAYVSMGDADGSAFYQMLNKYTTVDKVKADHLNELIEKLQTYDEVIIGFHKSNTSPWSSYKFTSQELVWLHEISVNHQVTLSVFARPYALMDLRSTTNLDGILMAYQNSKIAQEKAAQLLFGAIGAKGRLPVSIGQNFPEGTGYFTSPIGRLSYGLPESVGMNSFKLRKIDSIAEVAIAKKMTPGMQVLVARKGKVVLQKNYGFQTYDKKQPIGDESIYDLASLTKILATLPLLMELEEQGEITLDTSFGELLPYLKGTNKADITLLEALSHYGRFKPWIPFFRNTMEDNKASSKYYSTQKKNDFTIQVADHMYMRSDYRDSVLVEIGKSDLLTKMEYKYSDLPFYLYNDFLENYYNADLNILTKTHFYASLGAENLSYLPKKYFLEKNIVPSEIDDYWRNQTLRGYVNDQGAAMFGGLGGHAGLFGNSNDIAKMMQMYLNGGYYGGKRYFEIPTLKKFNKCYFCSEEIRRGVGFDKPQLKGPGP